MDQTMTAPAQLELIECPLCLQPFDPDGLGLAPDQRNRLLIGARLRQWRAASGMTVVAVAGTLEVTHPVILSFELGYRDIPLKRAIQLCWLYGKSLSELCAGYAV